MLSPKRTKFRKQHKGRNAGNAKGGFDLNCLSAMEDAPHVQATIKQAGAGR